MSDMPSPDRQALAEGISALITFAITPPRPPAIPFSHPTLTAAYAVLDRLEAQGWSGSSSREDVTRSALYDMLLFGVSYLRVDRNGVQRLAPDDVMVRGIAE